MVEAESREVDPPEPGRTLTAMLLQSAIILAVLFGLGLLLTWLGSSFFGTSFSAGLLATVSVALSGAVAHFAGEYPRGNEFALARLMVGMAVRTVPPLLVAVWALKIAEPPLEKSLVLYIILLYFVGLLLDVVFNVRHFKKI